MLDHLLVICDPINKGPHARGRSWDPSAPKADPRAILVDPLAPLGRPSARFFSFFGRPEADQKIRRTRPRVAGVVKLRIRYQGLKSGGFSSPSLRRRSGPAKNRRNPDRSRPGCLLCSPNAGFFRIFVDLKSNQKFIKKRRAQKTLKIENIWAQSAQITGFY